MYKRFCVYCLYQSKNAVSVQNIKHSRYFHQTISGQSMHFHAMVDTPLVMEGYTNRLLISQGQEFSNVKESTLYDLKCIKAYCVFSVHSLSRPFVFPKIWGGGGQKHPYPILSFSQKYDWWWEKRQKRLNLMPFYFENHSRNYFPWQKCQVLLP